MCLFTIICLIHIIIVSLPLSYVCMLIRGWLAPIWYLHTNNLKLRCRLKLSNYKSKYKLRRFIKKQPQKYFGIFLADLWRFVSPTTQTLYIPARNQNIYIIQTTLVVSLSVKKWYDFQALSILWGVKSSDLFFVKMDGRVAT